MDDEFRQRVRQRAGDKCEYCHIPQRAVPWARLHIEHIRARQHGGTDELANLALACHRCNAFKGPNLAAIDPVGGQLLPLFNPRRDSWNEHFAEREFFIVGLTEVGRATAALLNMNDPDRIHLRTEFAGGEDEP